MYGENTEQTRAKSDRALALFEKGLTTSQIAERLGVAQNNISAMLRHARKRREKVTEDKH